jgi:tetratricopeptide (TPR) repeat protein
MKTVQKSVILFVFLLCLPVLSAQEGWQEDLERGIELNQDERYKEAIVCLLNVLEADKSQYQARYELAYAYLQRGEEQLAIRHSKLIMKTENDWWLDACLILGAAYEQMGQTKKALKVYQKACHKEPHNYLVHYNLGLSYYNDKEWDLAEEAVSKAIRLNRSHSSSHFLMSYIMLEKREMVKAMLAMYFFLLVEQDTERTKKVYSMLELLWKSGVETNGESTLISLGNSKNDFYKLMELSVKLKAATYTEKQQLTDKLAVFEENTGLFFSLLAEMYDGSMGFWELTYIDYFLLLHQNGHTASFANYISNTNYQAQVLVWMSDHHGELNKFVDWLELNQF